MKSSDLQVVLVQNEIEWNNVAHNLNKLSLLLQNVSGSDLIVLPEMFATGFAVDDVPCQSETDTVLAWMQRMSLQTSAMVVGSVAFRENGNWYNRLLCVDAGEVVAHYDKRHLFLNSIEARAFEPGTAKAFFKCKGWTICPEIC